MTERKPAWMTMGSWVDTQIRDAQERGEFDGLPGHGKPLTGIDEPADELWWVKSWLRREKLSYLPPGLALRRDVEDFVAHLAGVPSEEELRSAAAELNQRIVTANATTITGPPSSLMPFDVERLVQRWRDARTCAS